QSLWSSLVRVDPVRRYLAAIDLAGAVLDAPAGRERAMHDNAELRVGADHPPVAKRLGFLPRVVGERLELQSSRRSSSRVCALRTSSWSWASASGDNSST